MKKYSSIRIKYGIVPEKDFENRQAFFTHYLQNHNNGVAQHFVATATDYLLSSQDEGTVLKEPYFHDLLPIRWDVPFPPDSNPKFRFIDLFAGIGGMRIAYQNAGGNCVFSSEWDKFAKKTYEANFGEVPFGDITQIDEKEIPDHEILLAGFPCQPFSIAGVSKKNSLGRNHGFLDETQGTLFFDIARIIKEKRPISFMLENVKNLVSHDQKRTFKLIKKTLEEELDYTIYYKVLDGIHFVPQHRERIIIVGFDNRKIKGRDIFEDMIMPEPTGSIDDILEHDPDPKYTLSNKLWNYLWNYAAKHKLKGNGFGFGLAESGMTTRTLSARYYKDGSEILIPQKNMNPRRLTPKECCNLMGYPDKFIIPVSDNQAYRQFGNSVVVPLIENVAKHLVEYLSKHESFHAKKYLQE